MKRYGKGEKQERKNISGKILLVALIAILLYLIVAGTYFYEFEFYAPAKPGSFTISDSTVAFSAYAWNTAQDEKGLMNATVTNSTFMLFYLGSRGIYPFWMKDTYSYLDIVWINMSANGTGTIVDMVNATPCSYYNPSQTSCIIYVPTSDSNYVIETHLGFGEINNVSVGEKIVFNYA